MIYGYNYQGEVLNEFGLLRMREVTIAAHPDELRSLAAFLNDVAGEMESDDALHSGWHRHVPPQLQSCLQCDVVVTVAENESTD